MKKLIWFIILVAIIIGAVLLVRGKEDTWIKASNGRWVRHGNPALPLPQNVLQDCYDQNSNRALDFAIIACREDLCGTDSACARSLEREFEKLSGSKKINETAPTTEAVGTPTEVSETNTNVPAPTPTSTSPETVKTINSNVDIPSPEHAPEEKPIVEQPANITIESPTRSSSVTSPLVITGKVKANTGDSITIQITNTSGTVLISETAKLKNVDSKTGWGTYKITLSYEFSTTKEGFLVVSNASNTQESLSIPLHFQ